MSPSVSWAPGPLYLGSRRRLRQAQAGTATVVLAALPEFVLASLLATVCGVWLG